MELSITQSKIGTWNKAFRGSTFVLQSVLALLRRARQTYALLINLQVARSEIQAPEKHQAPMPRTNGLGNSGDSLELGLGSWCLKLFIAAGNGHAPLFEVSYLSNSQF